MLNYIWLALIIVGILIAAATDIHDLTADRYGNGQSDAIAIRFADSTVLLPGSVSALACTVIPRRPEEGRSLPETAPAVQKGIFTCTGSGEGVLRMTPDSGAPARWRDRMALQADRQALTARVRWNGSARGGIPEAYLSFDPVRFVRLNAVTNDGILKSAMTAVELAIGLIGVMALWLGVMKIAEQAGLITLLARLLRPVTRLLFPDVPPEHPAMGAMIMNISANMLGLSNAATPLGLKAMEELNRLNPKAGTATDAMCTFLVINTSNVQLIPATVIAIRASAGSANAAEIVGPVLAATALSLIIGIALVKIFARFPVFRKQLAEER